MASAKVSRVQLWPSLSLSTFAPKLVLASVFLSSDKTSARLRMTACWTLAVSMGTKVFASATMPRSATWKMGAFSSRLMATMVLASIIPAVYWTAPEVPMENSRPGRTVFPVCPISRSSSTQCWRTGGRVAATSPPNAAASWRTKAKPSALPSPAPPTTTTSASSRLRRSSGSAELDMSLRPLGTSRRSTWICSMVPGSPRTSTA